MTKQEFLNELADIMQLDVALTGDENLVDFDEWDSMSSLGVMSMFDMEFGVNLKTDQLKNITTIVQLIELINEPLAD